MDGFNDNPVKLKNYLDLLPRYWKLYQNQLKNYLDVQNGHWKLHGNQLTVYLDLRQSLKAISKPVDRLFRVTSQLLKP